MRKNPKSFAMAAAAALSVATGAAAQDAVQWRVEDGGNGHWYATLGEVHHWPEARARCEQLGGYLATLTSAAEWSWVVTATNIEHGYVGGYQDASASDYEEPYGGWRWVTGEQFAFNSISMLPFDDCPGAAPASCVCGSGAQDVLFAMGCCGHMMNDSQDGTSFDCNMAGEVPYPPVDSLIEWSADCNNDGLVDYGQIRAGELEDTNANNIPDCCEGQLVSWGDNSLGQSTPPILRAPIDSITAGYDHSACLLTDGTVLVWGYNAFGQRDVPANLQNVVQISAGDRFMLALQANGVVRAWGFNDYGQCNVPADLPFVVKISAGGNHSMVQLSDGTLRCWGNNTSGESTVPTDLGSVSVFEGGVYHSIAVTTSSLIRCWGLDDYGQCTPPKAITTAVAVSGGDRHSVALLANGSVRCWGQNTYGQCTPPTDLPPLTAISASDRYTLGLTTAGRVVPWGVEIGQSPSSGTICTMIAAGAYHGIAALEQAECPIPCAADVTGNDNVDAADLAAILSAWGGAPTGKANADVNGDGSIDAADLAAVLSSWGPCP